MRKVVHVVFVERLLEGQFEDGDPIETIVLLLVGGAMDGRIQVSAK
jgi:hypothetical protein